VFTRLALGIAVGAVFPWFAELLGVPAEFSRATTFRLACLAVEFYDAAGVVQGRRIRAPR